MNTKLMFAALLASAVLAQAGPPMSPAKIKKPLHISQIKSIFHKDEPSAPVPVPQQAKAGTATSGASSTAAAPSEVVPPAPVRHKKPPVRTFLNHPVTAPGPH